MNDANIFNGPSVSKANSTEIFVFPVSGNVESTQGNVKSTGNLVKVCFPKCHARCG